MLPVIQGIDSKEEGQLTTLIALIVDPKAAKERLEALKAASEEAKKNSIKAVEDVKIAEGQIREAEVIKGRAEAHQKAVIVREEAVEAREKKLAEDKRELLAEKAGWEKARKQEEDLLLIRVNEFEASLKKKLEELEEKRKELKIKEEGIAAKELLLKERTEVLQDGEEKLNSRLKQFEQLKSS